MATGSLAPVVQYLRKVTNPAAVGDIADAELLSRFAIHRDEAAFASLVRRHGPMVLAVCRRVVRDGHAAEDAFQATFLVLARKAASLTHPELLANWLHGVAYRTAMKARIEAAKRRLHEARAARPQEIGPSEESDWLDLRAVLDEEVNRLPERYRVPVVLCYLQGQTNAEAARRLGCSRGTVATLLARARDKLRRRLTQRGVGLSVGVSLAVLMEAVRGSAAPVALQDLTVKAAMLLAAGQTQAVGALAAQAIALAKGVSKGMLMEKLKIPAAILMMTALVGAGAGVDAYRAGAGESEVAESKSEAQPPPPNKTAQSPKPVASPILLIGSDAVRKDDRAKDDKATVRTANFIVTAPTVEIARQVGEAAEHNRKALAKLWLDKELATWAEPCPVRVTIRRGAVAGASDIRFQDWTWGDSSTGFCFQLGVVARSMRLDGPLDRIFADLLPHEMTHTILAEWRGRPLPRWADEGAAMLGESADSRARHEQALEKLLRAGHPMPLIELLPRSDLPKDVKTFYAQSFSLTDFLVTAGGRKKFLAFVFRSQNDGWEKAANAVYGYKSVEALEQAWLDRARKRHSNLVEQYYKRAWDLDPPVDQKAQAAPLIRQLKLRSGEQALFASFKGQLPPEAPPKQALVVLDAEDRLSTLRRTFQIQPVLEAVTLKDGQMQMAAKVNAKMYPSMAVYDFRTVRVYDIKGREVDKKTLRERLKRETLALILMDGPIDPQNLRLYKEDTLVFVLQGPPLQSTAPPEKAQPSPSLPAPAVLAEPIVEPAAPVKNRGR